MKHTSISDLEYAAMSRVTRRDCVLGEIDAVAPWSALVVRIAPRYPKGEGRGRPPIGVERMLRMCIAQPCFGLPDEGIEDAIYDSQAIRKFIGIDLGRESAPDPTTLLKFRRPHPAVAKPAKAHEKARCDGLLMARNHAPAFSHAGLSRFQSADDESREFSD